MILCPRCQTQNSDNSIRCNRCGYFLQMSPLNTNQNSQFSQQKIPANFDESNILPKNSTFSNVDKNTKGKQFDRAILFLFLITTFLLIILLIMIVNLFFSAKSMIDTKEENGVTISDTKENASEEADSILNKNTSMENQSNFLSFEDLDIESIKNPSLRFFPPIYDDIFSNCGETIGSYLTTSYTRKINLGLSIGKYYRIKGKIQDVYSSGSVFISIYEHFDTPRTDGKDPEVIGNIVVYNFSEEQLRSFKVHQEIDIIVKISDAVCDDGDRSCFVKAAYVQNYE